MTTLTSTEPTPQLRVFVANVQYGATRQELADFLIRSGHPPADVQLATNEHGRFRGYAFITFGTRVEAEAAIGFLHGRAFRGRALVAHPAKSQAIRR